MTKTLPNECDKLFQVRACGKLGDFNYWVEQKMRDRKTLSDHEQIALLMKSWFMVKRWWIILTSTSPLKLLLKRPWDFLRAENFVFEKIEVFKNTKVMEDCHRILIFEGLRIKSSTTSFSKKLKKMLQKHSSIFNFESSTFKHLFYQCI